MIAVSTPQREIASSQATKINNGHNIQIAQQAEDYDVRELISDPEQSLRFFLLQSKFPLVFVPFISELKRLGPESYEILLKMKTFMQTLPRGFRDYDVSPDDPQDVYLLSDLCVYAPREEDGEGGFYVPKGHHGRIIPNESNTFCVQWRYEYDGWSFLGRVLEHAATVSPTDVIVEEIISLISTTLQSVDNYTAMDMLESLCTKLRLEDDVINIIGKVLMNAMQRKNVNVSVAAIDFFTALIPVLPHKVWEFLSNSNLLDRNGGGMATFILSSVEIISGDYRFTLGVIQLVNVLVKDAVIGKFSTLIEPDLRMNVLLQFARHLSYIYESFAYWKYENLSHRLDIAISISDLFSSLLLAVYGIDEATDGINKINGVLVPAAQHLLDRFLVSDGKNFRCIQPIIGSIEASGRSLQALTADPELLNRNYEWIEAALIFAEKLTRVRTLLKRAPSQLERKLFGLAPAMTQLFVRENVLRFRIMKLLISMVDSVWEGTEPPSLLAHLGPGSALTFVNALNKALEGKRDLNTQNEIARFASVVFSNKQQGLSVLLLTGRELGKDNGKQKTDKESETSLLQALEKKAEQFEDLPVELSVNVLECIALAQNSRATAVFENKTNLDFLKKNFEILDRGTGGRISGLESTDTIIRFCYNALLAARAVQLCAVELHKSIRDSTESKSIVDYFVKSGNLAKLADTAFRIQGYRASLHGNLHRNFDKKWPMAKLIRFQKTSISQKPYGPSYKYDLEMMDDIFSADPIWTGYRSEIVQANLNLSLIDAQSHLFKAWWLLIAALVEHAENNSKLLKALEQIAIQCLQINLDEGIMAPLFIPIVNDRSQLAFVITQTLHAISSASCRKQQFDFTKILSLAWEFTSSVDVDFPQALTDGYTETYRPLLRLLLVCVGALKGTKADASISQIISGILENIVSKTFMILGPDALEAFDLSKSQQGVQEWNESAKDMLLVTSLLRDCLTVDGVL
ncbi:nucleoporin subcomplex protein binding to Pom34-domain-containing protein [Lipomyces kononenkoae]|uniref:Nucleoporin subcomplex protein binding to Pom34-domain-containing protein n=1 Tax=Lipomyces kononenkoae TaxID=34357 RepID=A0ACC3TCP7_LIPKO